MANKKKSRRISLAMKKAWAKKKAAKEAAANLGQMPEKPEGGTFLTDPSCNQKLNTGQVIAESNRTTYSFYIRRPDGTTIQICEHPRIS